MLQSVVLLGTRCDDPAEQRLLSPLRSSARAVAPETTKGNCLNKGCSGDKEPSAGKLWRGLHTNTARLKSKGHNAPCNWRCKDAQNYPALDRLMTSLQNANLRSLINYESFMKLPTACQQHLLSLLPEPDRQLGDDGSFQLGSSALCNEFFSSATLGWQERLAVGDEVQQCITKELAKARLSADKPHVDESPRSKIGDVLSSSRCKGGTNSANAFVKDRPQQVHSTQHNQRVSVNVKDLILILPRCTVRLENCLSEKVVGSGNRSEEIQPLRNGCFHKRLSKYCKDNNTARLKNSIDIDKSHATEGGVHKSGKLEDPRKKLEEISSAIGKHSVSAEKLWLTNKKVLKTAVRSLHMKGRFGKPTPFCPVKEVQAGRHVCKRPRLDPCPSASTQKPKSSFKTTPFTGSSASTPKRATESALLPRRKRNSIDWMRLSASACKRPCLNCPLLGDEPELPQTGRLRLPHLKLVPLNSQDASSDVAAHTESEKMHLANAEPSGSGKSALVENWRSENIHFHLPSTSPPPPNRLQHDHEASHRGVEGDQMVLREIANSPSLARSHANEPMKLSKRLSCCMVGNHTPALSLRWHPDVLAVQHAIDGPRPQVVLERLTTNNLMESAQLQLAGIAPRSGGESGL